MGALARTRKRIDECLTSNSQSPSPFSPNSRLSKRPKLFSLPPPPAQVPARPGSTSTVAARLARYPQPQQPLPRVHAPCPGKFSSDCTARVRVRIRVSEDDENERMGGVLGINLWRRRNAEATKEKKKKAEVIRIDEDENELPNRVSEVVEMVEDDDDEPPTNVMEVEMEEEMKLKKRKKPSECSAASDMTTLVMNSGSSGLMRVEKENTNNMREMLSWDPEDKPRYKKMIEVVERRSSKLKQLEFEIQVTESKKALHESLRPKKKPVEDAVIVEPFVPLKEEEKAVVDRALNAANGRRVLVTHENSSIQITGEILQCLKPRAWLNDEVINLYLELLKEREKREPKKFLKCHFFNTFFYKKLIGGKSGYDYKAVGRWTTQRKLGYSITDCEKIFVPIHKEIHWCLAVINQVDQKFQYLDSLRGRDTKVMNFLAKYYIDEVKDKTGKDIDVSSWNFEYVEDLPEQENGYDCGVFMIKYADFYSRGLDLCFQQKHMPYFRLRTAKELLQLRAD